MIFLTLKLFSGVNEKLVAKGLPNLVKSCIFFKFYDTGRVHVFTNKWSRNSGFNFNLVKSNTIGDKDFRQVFYPFLEKLLPDGAVI